jgi:hypothetical protein
MAQMVRLNMEDHFRIGQKADADSTLGCLGRYGRIVPILLQKSAIRAARPLPQLLGTVLTIRPLMSNDALKGHRPV